VAAGEGHLHHCDLHNRRKVCGFLVHNSSGQAPRPSQQKKHVAARMVLVQRDSARPGNVLQQGLGGPVAFLLRAELEGSEAGMEKAKAPLTSV